MIDFDDLEEAEGGGEASEEAQAPSARAEEKVDATDAPHEAAAYSHEEAVPPPLPAAAPAAPVRQAEPEAEPDRYWKVVHSTDAGGLAVQAQENLRSQTIGRLTVGSVVQELACKGNRMHFQWVKGHTKGPMAGWVSIKAAGPWGKESLKCLGSWSEFEASLQASAHQQPVVAQGQAVAALVFIDWDDTLCPTTWLQQQNDLRQVSRDDEAWRQLADEARAAGQLLRAASSLGTVVLVTLADRAWVGACVRDYLPELAEQVAALDVFHAGEESVGQMRAGADLDLASLQKKRAMEKAMDTLASRLGPKTTWESLVSIGDSEAERSAAKDIGRECKITGRVNWTKTVKLRDHPDIAQLTSQLQALERMLPELVAHQGSRNVNLD
mmetsp:Transcript_7446/g.23407  ORF Transcript_7446/g.23407 Transcript_7446/m.23407 type:complete len:383 (-) Transcript_7446:69-1217(-)